MSMGRGRPLECRTAGIGSGIMDAIHNELEIALEDHPILAIDSAEAVVKADPSAVAAEVVSAAKDVLPSHWDENHPAADIYAKLKASIARFEAFLKRI